LKVSTQTAGDVIRTHHIISWSGGAPSEAFKELGPT